MTYLSLSFFEEPTTDALAKAYVEVFKKFPNVGTLRIEVMEDGGLTQMCKVMNADTAAMPWFKSVQRLTCFMVLDMEDKGCL